MQGPEGDIPGRARLRFEVWSAFQGINVSAEEAYNRFCELGLTGNEALKHLFELAINRPDYLQGGITDLTRDFPFPQDGLLNPLGVGAFIQIYIDETTRDDERVQDERRSLSPDEYRERWYDLGFKHLGNSDEETQQLLQWMQEHPKEVVECFGREWKLAQEYSEEFLERAERGELKKRTF